MKSVKRLSEELGVSKQTIFNNIIEYRDNKTGKHFVY